MTDNNMIHTSLFRNSETKKLRNQENQETMEKEKRMKILEKKIFEKDGKRFITFPLMEERGIKNIMTTSDFNTGLSTCGVETLLKSQYDRVKDLLGESSSPLYLMKQEHTDRSIVAGTEGENVEKMYGFMSYSADGLMTDRLHTVTAVTVADCVPVIIYDRKNNAFSNIHSGWKGTLSEISLKALEKMTEVYGTDPSDCDVFILPHISSEDFEVECDVEKMFRDKFAGFENIIFEKGNGKFLIDLNTVITEGLISLGVERGNIYISPDSTKSMDIYHSYRRDGKKFGIMSVVCCLK